MDAKANGTPLQVMDDGTPVEVMDAKANGAVLQVMDAKANGICLQVMDTKVNGTRRHQERKRMTLRRASTSSGLTMVAITGPCTSASLLLVAWQLYWDRVGKNTATR
mmetsp:Transcript_55614/g.98629  ORF Transcript_55614/g.98629 Transcript_55614/m.98629 type:complete len:107 (-) Transcript_55614:312-632(-)